ncbi:hypothetical protein PQO01_13465 [Lentisphaera marina]|uniref:sulfotransferase n=1 Tax=Lentisphaera marina TaxID=1111041 RepID=UPI002366D9C1|nr:sulfotransferase [Lentisphaera marina]MDD7985953.1 hypothetical protein [Lentisphaera marina]
MRKKIKKLFQLSQIKKLENEPKVFCISMQRTGTTSTGQFFRDNGMRCIGWGGDRDNKWSRSWYKNNYQEIFNSIDFRTANAYEDSPWWLPEFYKVLDKEFPQSRFILLERDADKWFNSMKSHSAGNTPGAMAIHSKAYRREDEFTKLKKQGLISKEDEYRIDGDKAMKVEDSHRQHYIQCYLDHIQGVIEYFKNEPIKLFHGQLEDSGVWKKMGDFLGFDIADNYQAVKNVTATSKRRQGFKKNSN